MDQNQICMKKLRKSLKNFEEFRLKGVINAIRGGDDDPGEGDGKDKPKPPPPPPGPFGPVIIKN